MLIVNRADRRIRPSLYSSLCSLLCSHYISCYIFFPDHLELRLSNLFSTQIHTYIIFFSKKWFWVFVIQRLNLITGCLDLLGFEIWKTHTWAQDDFKKSSTFWILILITVKLQLSKFSEFVLNTHCLNLKILALHKFTKFFKKSLFYSRFDLKSICALGFQWA